MENLHLVVDKVKALLPFVADPQEVIGYEANSADVVVWRRHRVSIRDDLLLELVASLQTIPELSELDGGVAHYSPSSQGTILIDSIAQWLLAQARFSPVEECLGRLMKAVDENRSPMQEIIPVWGISPRMTIDLGEGIKIIPIEDLPVSRLKDLFTGVKRHPYSFEIANSFPKPGAAIVKETVHGPLYESSKSDAAITSRREGELFAKALMAQTEHERQAAAEEFRKSMSLKLVVKNTSIYNQAEELALVVALCLPRPLFLLGQWFQRPVDLPLVGMPSSYSGPTNDHPFHIPVEKQDYPVKEIEALVKHYRSLPLEIRKRLRTPLSRLNQGRRQHAHHTLEAGAIDLGIAVESLLASDRDRDASISFIIRARGTLLQNGSSDEKRKTYKTLKDLYDLRSRVAHQGLIVENIGSPLSESDRRRLEQASSTINAGEELCKALIRKIIEAGHFPKWDDLMFGW